MRRSLVVAALGFALATAGAQAQQYVFPAKGQTPDQQKKDEGACHTWAVDQSKYDPAKPPPPPPQQEAPKGGRLRGAAAGAVVGEVVSGDASSGAAAGAVAGGVAQRNAARQQAAQQQQQAAAQQNAGLASYQKARAACLEGKGYTVK